MDCTYLHGQKDIYNSFQAEREKNGHPGPLGFGVMMWDEVKVQMKVAWNLKGGGMSGFNISEEELKVLHNVYSASVQTRAQKASYILQFL